MIYGDLTSLDLGRIAPQTIALLPIAALEQHGCHLPVITDTALVTEIVQRAESALSETVALLPTMWAGSSHHHKGFPGTMSIRSETYIRMLEDLIECLIDSGFKKIAIINGHGGNVTPMAEALYRISLKYQEHDAPWVVATSYWRLGAEQLASQAFMETPKLTHACEYETSMMLGLRADWVRMERAVGDLPTRKSAYYDPLGYRTPLVTVSETFSQLTDSGALGSPEKAAPDKGLRLFEVYSATLIAFLTEFSTWPQSRR
jgi:creatinine amidohydrolase